MATPTGMPIWYELMTGDVDAAKRFYGAIVGWTTQEMPTAPGMPPYTIWQASDDGKETGIGGLVPQMPDGAGPGWYAYFQVADVDAKMAENEAAGGRTHMGGYDIPHVGRIALVEDSQGIIFYLMTPDASMGDQESTSFSRTLPGRVAWNELVTTDHKAALAFYGDLLGFTSPRVMNMGPMGDYTFVAAGGTEIGAMMDRSADGQPTRWTFYFRVPDVDAAVDRVKDGGGQVVMGPMDVPGGERVIVAIDPQGASFGLVSGENS